MKNTQTVKEKKNNFLRDNTRQYPHFRRKCRRPVNELTVMLNKNKETIEETCLLASWASPT